MLICKNLEAKLVEQFASALTTAGLATSVTVRGAWQDALNGLVKWVDESFTPAYLSISVGTPSYEAFSNPVMTFPASVSLFVRIEADPTGQTLSSVASVIEETERGWVSANYASPFTALDCTGLKVDGVSINGGVGPAVSEGVAAVNFDLTLTGSPVAQTNNNQE